MFKGHSRSWIYLVVTDYLMVVGCFAVVMRLRFMPEIDIIDISELRIIPRFSSSSSTH